MKENTIKAALAAALGALCAYGVQLLVPVLVLVVVMLLDYATGMAKAWNAGEGRLFCCFSRKTDFFFFARMLY